MSDSLKQTLLATFRVLLNPLVRILLRQGISYAEFAEVAKAVYVETAIKDFKVTGRKATRTRIAVITGLTRKEVKRVIDEAVRERYELKTSYNRLGRVLVGWHTDPEFIGPYGMPLELQYESSEPTDITFTQLVKKHSGDMSPRSIVDELIRVEAVQEGEGGWLKVLRRDYIPESQGLHNFERTGNVIRNFVNTVDFNMTKSAPGKGRFERTVYANDGLRLEDVQKFDTYLRERSQALLEEIDNWITKLPQPKDGEHVERVKTGLGIYHYVGEELDERSFKDILIDEDLIKLPPEKGSNE